MKQEDVMSSPVQKEKISGKFSQIFMSVELVERSSKDFCFIFS
jgi:hypothetical protein